MGDVIYGVSAASSLFFTLLSVACVALALTAILIRKRNPKQSVAVLIISIPTVLLAEFLMLSNFVITLFALAILAIVFLVLAIVKKDTALLVTVLSMVLIAVLLFGLSSDGCSIGGCANEGETELPPAETTLGTPVTTTPYGYATEYITLQYEHYDPGLVYVSGYSWSSCSEPVELTDASQIPVIDGMIDLVIPERTSDGREVVAIGAEAFYGVDSIKSVTLPSTVTNLQTRAFYTCSNLQTVNFGGTTYIGESVFHGCDNLQNLIGFENITYIENHAFYDCSSLTSVSFGDSLSIGDFAFSGCGLEQVTVPAGVSSLGAGVFRDCSSLTSAEIHSSYYQIPAELFDNCHALSSVRLSASVEEIRNYAFSDCYALSQIIFEGSPDNWNSVQIGDENDAIYNASIDFLG